MISKKSLAVGVKVELEHAHNFPKGLQSVMARRIAADHLRESPKYYVELKKMERRLKI